MDRTSSGNNNMDGSIVYSIACPYCGSKMELFEKDYTCTCSKCVELYDVWPIDNSNDVMLMETAYESILEH